MPLLALTRPCFLILIISHLSQQHAFVYVVKDEEELSKTQETSIDSRSMSAVSNMYTLLIFTNSIGKIPYKCCLSASFQVISEFRSVIACHPLTSDSMQNEIKLLQFKKAKIYNYQGGRSDQWHNRIIIANNDVLFTHPLNVASSSRRIAVICDALKHGI